LVTALLLTLIALQQVQVEAVIDRDRVRLGETVVLTITVEATGNEPVQILNPSALGLEILGSIDQSDVSIRDGIATRTITRELRLRANAAGTARIGATTVRAGESVAQTQMISVTVIADEEDSGARLAPHIRRMVERHQPAMRAADEVFVEVLTSTDSVVLGQQLDLAVVAWFPQQIRSLLRTPPTLQPPELQGAWTYSQGVPHAVDMRRVIGGTPYQVYVHPVVVFPLTPGDLEIGPATVSYSMPMSYSFLSREVRHQPQSDRTRIRVVEQPANGRPTFFEGAAGSRLELSIDADPVRVVVGGASVVTAILHGEGNVALWPEPRIGWPEGIRAYPEAVEVNLEPDAERITGSKTFRYLVVPDSSGTHRIPQTAYAYYDMEMQRYLVLRTPELPIVAEFGSSSTALGRTTPRPLMSPGGRATLTRLAGDVPPLIWLLIAALPPLLTGAATVIRRLMRMRRDTPRSSERTLDRSEQEFRETLYDLVGEVERSGGAELSAALRAAGIDAPIAAHAARVRERVWQANYGPEREIDPEELTAEVKEILKALAGSMGAIALLLMCLIGTGGGLSAQSAERLYEAGVLRAAADSFESRASANPLGVSNWYNLGATWERVGEITRARRAWIRAARLSPRNGSVRTALNQLPPLDITSSRMTPVSPITPAEAFLVATCLWIVAWGCIVLKVRTLITAPTLLLALAFAAYGMQLHNTYAIPVAFVSLPEVPLRSAPYGPAQPRQFLPEGVAVRVARTDGAWMLVERGVERGWLLREEVIALR
jgi:hypothetical protein